MDKLTNANKATIVGAVAGSSATPAIVWVAEIIQAKYGIPAGVTMPLLGAGAALFMRWAANLQPGV